MRLEANHFADIEPEVLIEIAQLKYELDVAITMERLLTYHAARYENMMGDKMREIDTLLTKEAER
jgi:hypothetical protein